jgi:hypothetical protein
MSLFDRLSFQEGGDECGGDTATDFEQDFADAIVSDGQFVVLGFPTQVDVGSLGGVLWGAQRRTQLARGLRTSVAHGVPTRRQDLSHRHRA